MGKKNLIDEISLRFAERIERFQKFNTKEMITRPLVDLEAVIDDFKLLLLTNFEEKNCSSA